jgi:SAM-dependent MidA family methyltransferase
MLISSNSQPLVDILVDRIANSPKQRISFADYMDLVLYHPQQGYYASGRAAIGSSGDFFTSSSLGKDFGELLAEQFYNMWEVLGQPNRFTLVEMGAGSGTLAADILSYLQQSYPQIFDYLEYIIVERAEGLITRQQDLLKSWIDENVNISWRAWQDIDDNFITGCVFSNELVDALPVHQITISQGKLQEIYVTHSEGKFQETVDEISTQELAKYFDSIGVDITSDNYPDNYRSEVNLSALNWLETVAKKLRRGYLLTIDYGYNAQRYYNPQRYRGTLQCYYQHRRHDNPYINVGYQDITARVDFTALEHQGERCGLQNVGFTQQGMFLMALGLGDRLNDLSSGKYNFEQIIKRRDALHQLIDPAGLGGFGVLIQSKGLTQEKMRSLKGLTQPSF